MYEFSKTSRFLTLAYGISCYVVFFATFVYSIGFIGDLVVPKTIDGPPTMGFAAALGVDLALLALFAVQHSVMARPAFKRAWTRVVPAQVERSTYVLFSCLALGLLYAAWQPLGGQVWQVTNPIGAGALYAGMAIGWLLVFVSTCLINHFDLFGLRQVWLYFHNKPYTELAFVTPWPYRVVRHPLYVGWLCVIWFTPSMTGTHLLFAVMTTAYVLIGIRLEEHDLEVAHPSYGDYKQHVPMLVPRVTRPTSNGPSAIGAGAGAN